MTAHGKSGRFGGVHIIMPTPFTDMGELDLPSLERLTDFLIDRGVDGLVVLGVVGEAPKLSQEERDAVLRTTVQATSGRVPVYAGAGGDGTDLLGETAGFGRIAPFMLSPAASYLTGSSTIADGGMVRAL